MSIGGERGAVIYQMLQQISVYISNGISKTVSIKQDHDTVTIEQETAYFHLDSQNDILKLFIPRQQGRRRVCLQRQLPITLLKYLGVKNATGCDSLGAIIVASSLFEVDEFLRHDGIIEVEGVDRPETNEVDETASVANNTNSTITQATHGFLINSDRKSSAAFISSNAASSISSPSRNSASSNLTSATSIFQHSPKPVDRVDLYRKLLTLVILKAKEISDLPEAGSMVTSCLPVQLGLDVWHAVESPFDGEESYKIGAAGELFVSVRSLNVMALIKTKML